MSLSGILAELRHRGVLKVATVYLGTAVVVLEAGTHLLHNFEAPHWVLKVFTTLLILGFPIACMMAWGFEFSAQGVHAAPPITSESAPAPRRTDALFAAALIVIFGLVTAVVVRQWRQPVTAAEEPAPKAVTASRPQVAEIAPTAAKPAVPLGPSRVPTVVIMDTPALRGVYEDETRNNGGTNADDLNDLLRDLPINILKESIGATWEREHQVLAQQPDLVLVHRSGFFHAMNQEFGFGYPDDAARFDETRARRLYELSDNKLVAVLGYLGQGNQHTMFIVYSRGTGGGWTDEPYRLAWVKKVEGRFPFLKGRVTALNVPGGTSGGSFDDQETAAMFRGRVQSLLGLSTTLPEKSVGGQGSMKRTQ